MRRDYTFPKELDYVLYYDSSLNNYIYNYQESFVILSNIIGYFFHGNKVFLSFVKEELCNNNPIITLLAADLKNRKQNITVKIAVGSIELISAEESLLFSCSQNSSGYDARLIKYELNTKEKKIIEREVNHTIFISVIIGNKKFQFEVPYEIESFIDTDFFQFIKKDSDISSLRKLYLRRFYTSQSLLEKNMNSYVRVFLITDSQEVLLDEYVFQKGFVQSYVLSQVSGNTIMSLIGGVNKPKEYTIKCFENSSSIDLNVMARTLEKRSMRVNLEL